MATTLQQQYNSLPADASRILYVNVPSTLTADLLYQFFGQFGPLADLRVKAQHDANAATAQESGSALSQSVFVVYENILDAKNALEQLNSSTSTVGFIKARYFQVTKPIPN